MAGSAYPDAVHPLGQGPTRWLRAGVLVALTVLVSLGGHALAGGTVHVSGPMVLGVLALGAACVAAAEVRRSFPEILAVVLLAQPVLHLLASMGGHQHGAGNPTTAGGVSTGMLLAHLAASVLVSALLADADRVLWALAGLVVRVLPPAAAPVPVPAAGVPVVRVPCVPLPLALRSAPRRRRGPPVVVAAA